MQKNKKCDDFEVRFCCSKIDRPEILSTKQPVYNESVDLEGLNDINDLRKMNKYLKNIQKNLSPKLFSFKQKTVHYKCSKYDWP